MLHDYLAGKSSQYFLILNKFGIILTFRGLFQAIESNKPSKIYMFLAIKGFLMKWGCRGNWGHWGCWDCWGHWGHLSSWFQGNHLICKVQAVILTKKGIKKPKPLKKKLKIPYRCYIFTKCSYSKNYLNLINGAVEFQLDATKPNTCYD